uniref:Uncharacterized protein n=1 Tax=Schizaphis graminum TaxID=13262 RepID=A0A2S2NLF9_SCHGA
MCTSRSTSGSRRGGGAAAEEISSGRRAPAPAVFTAPGRRRCRLFFSSGISPSAKTFFSLYIYARPVIIFLYLIYYIVYNTRTHTHTHIYVLCTYIMYIYAHHYMSHILAIRYLREHVVAGGSLSSARTGLVVRVCFRDIRFPKSSEPSTMACICDGVVFFSEKNHPRRVLN